MQLLISKPTHQYHPKFEEKVVQRDACPIRFATRAINQRRVHQLIVEQTNKVRPASIHEHGLAYVTISQELLCIFIRRGVVGKIFKDLGEPKLHHALKLKEARRPDRRTLLLDDYIQRDS